ncbi:hypothetical protein LSCM4_08379 [Leishmania orientalis]|uniref:C2H2-type domain-containing protein n=1 Tax=Leishmania orientalis TaxID=2249476 RepID=A0A836KV85_9TRYP|nr:hypothetical protein LSCM4_08379 [Leishmania orientalis]
MSHAAATTLVQAWRRLALAPSLPATSSVSLSSVAAATFKSPEDNRPKSLRGAPLSTIAVMNLRRLGAAPRSLPSSLHRRPYCLWARCNRGNGCREISSAVPPCATPASTSVSSSAPSAPSCAPRERHLCPECGKRFLCESNLVRHRTTRHGVQVASASEVARAQLAASNAQLQQELVCVQARVKQLREGSDSGSRQERDGGTTVLAEDAAKAYPSALLTGRLMEVDAAVERAWRRSGRGLGTGVSLVDCVGTVIGAVEVGTLRGTAPASAADSVAAGPRVLQFMLEAHGYRERRPGQLKMYRAHILVRYVAWQPYHRYGADDDAPATSPPSTTLLPFKVQEGDLLHVHGHYALHKSYDMVSKQSVESVVLEADAVGMLRPAPAKVASTVREERDTRPAAAAAPCAPSPTVMSSPPLPSPPAPPSRHGSTPAGKEAVCGTDSHRRYRGEDSVISANVLLPQQQRPPARKKTRRSRKSPRIPQAR